MKIQLCDNLSSVVETALVRTAKAAWATSGGSVYEGDTTDENAIPAISVTYSDGARDAFLYHIYFRETNLHEIRNVDLKKFLA